MGKSREEMGATGRLGWRGKEGRQKGFYFSPD